MKNPTKWENLTLLFLRLVIAAIFLYAGYGKWSFWSDPQGMSGNMLLLIKFLSIVEPLGAVALISGFLTRWAAAGLAIIMVGAIFVVKYTMGAALFTGPQGVGWDYNLLILACCLAILTFGAGTWSIDRTWNKN